MITLLKIQNFQCHDRLRVDLAGVTSIVGPSDVGKSALIRSLKWLVTNSPQGDEFIQDGANGCTVIAEIDGYKIKRRKGKGVNEYLLDDKPFKAFGNSVPDPIKNILKIDQLNFQNQHDSPFWFCETAGQVSRNLNAIIDLELIDKCLSSVNKKVNKYRTEVEIVEGRFKALIQKKNKLTWVKEASKEFKFIEELEKTREEIGLKCARLYNQILQTTDAKEDETTARLQLKDLRKITELGDGYRKISGRIEDLSISIRLIISFEKILKTPDITSVEKLVEKYKAVCVNTKDLLTLIRLIKLTEKTIIDPDIREIDKVFESYAKNHSKIKILVDLIGTIKGNLTRIKLSKDEAKEIEEELHEKTEGMCPLCGKIMS